MRSAATDNDVGPLSAAGRPTAAPEAASGSRGSWFEGTQAALGFMHSMSSEDCHAFPLCCDPSLGPAVVLRLDPASLVHHNQNPQHAKQAIPSPRRSVLQSFAPILQQGS